LESFELSGGGEDGRIGLGYEYMSFESHGF
jgi:hypothetical protein